MLKIVEKKRPAPTREIRDTLFGDMPLEEYGADASDVEPWSSFAAASEHLRAGRGEEAIGVLRGIAGRKNLEPRHTLQAWHLLRGLGVEPPDAIAKIVYGVVVEVGLDGGTDLVAAYTDHSARYYNYSGSGVVWEAPDDSLDGAIDALIEAGQEVAKEIGPWDEARPAAPPEGHVRINMLTPSGLHFGQAPFEALQADSLAGPVIGAAFVLMQALVGKGSRE